ncbi:MAG: hypothetical protein HGJ93_07515 [Desulfosarcina sp.]|nr:hypothetical protein [Desulfosarcina sp.]MBC2765792.1 hypothetical protein [Desulfosarcina sp.]
MKRTAVRFCLAGTGIAGMEKFDFMKTEKGGQCIQTFIAKQDLSIEIFAERIGLEADAG